MKKVIFVGGTSFSGSTLLDMILSNDPRGFSCGEVVALFHPYRPHHIKPECGCGNSNCNLWSKVLKSGKENLYRRLFELFPNVNFIIDSSKDAFWINWQTKKLKNQQISVKNILILKTPLELAKSLDKRNRIKDLQKTWINYHRLYSTLVKDWRSIRYFDLTNNVMSLKYICDYLEIPYFPGKEKYWKKKHHTLFGNTSAKIHLYADNTQLFEKAKDELLKQRTLLSSQIDEKMQTLYYESPSTELEQIVSHVVSSDRRFSFIQSKLDSKDLNRRSQEQKLNIHNMPSLKYNKLEIFMTQINHTLKHHLNRRKIVDR